MIIGLDWDGTVTSDPDVFFHITALLIAAGHQVHIVTMRYPSEGHDISDKWRNLVTGVHFTSRKAKAQHMFDKGICVNVWIDDNPRAVYQTAAQIWGNASPEGTVVDVKYDLKGNSFEVIKNIK